jgi:RNA polymerase sigma factor (sigma-70 family)
MTNLHLLADDAAFDADDVQLVTSAQNGNQEALEALIRRHQSWIYNIVLRMAYNPFDAEDATQEILIKLITRLSTFERRSSFRTWLYRIVVNHVLNMKRGRSESHGLNFASYAESLDATPDKNLPDPRATGADVQLLVEEAKTVCTTAVLLCLDREQRLVFILGEILGVTDVVAAELLEISRDNFRQKLTRARRDLYSFLHGKCGLVNAANPCRCAKKTKGFIKAGYVDPEKLMFLSERTARVREVAKSASEQLGTLDEAYADIYRDHPFQNSPDFVASLKDLINSSTFGSIVKGR